MSKNFGDSELGQGLGCASMILAVFIGLSLPLMIRSCEKVNRASAITVKVDGDSIGEQ